MQTNLMWQKLISVCPGPESAKGMDSKGTWENKYLVFRLWPMDLSTHFGLYILNGCHLLLVNYTSIKLVLKMT